MKLALIYDRVNKFGGAERVLLALHEIFPDAPLFTAVYNPKTASWADVFIVKTTCLNKNPYFRTHHELLPLLTPIAFAKLDLSDFDVIISVTSAEAKFAGFAGRDSRSAVSTNKSHVHSSLHICYCLTPTRYLWSHRNFYEQQGISGKILKLFSKYLRTQDLKAVSQVDHFIAISKEVQNRIQKYYHRDSLLIYPPVETKNLPLSQSRRTNVFSPSTNFYLTVSRLVPYKRIDLAIKACNQLQRHLVIIGTGSQLSDLRKIAGSTIAFKGNLTDEQVSSYYEKCQALIFPGEEDFGIVPVEAQSYGKPVIAYASGGALETVIDGKTGVLFDEQNPDSLAQAILKLEKLQKQAKIKALNCKVNAHKFDEQIFKIQFKKTIKNLYKKFLNQ